MKNIKSPHPQSLSQREREGDLGKGYTLIEMVLVILLLSIIGVASYVATTSVKTQHLRAAADRVFADILYAKNLAQNSGVWHGVDFDVDPTNTYTLYKTDGTTDTNLKNPENISHDFTVDFKNDYKGIVISSASLEGGSKVEFNAYGIPYEDKTGSSLESTGIITLSDGQSAISVRIAPSTGRVYLQ